jgi:hypothetical protein
LVPVQLQAPQQVLLPLPLLLLLLLLQVFLYQVPADAEHSSCLQVQQQQQQRQEPRQQQATLPWMLRDPGMPTCISPHLLAQCVCLQRQLFPECYFPFCNAQFCIVVLANMLMHNMMACSAPLYAVNPQTVVFISVMPFSFRVC